MTLKEKFSKRAVIALGLLIIPLASFIFLDQSQRNRSDNNYVNELASNGPYQLFAAFRNNTLNYRQFYKTGEDKILSQTLKKEVFQQSGEFCHKGVYNIARHIKATQPSEQLNVILISVESLSAKFSDPLW